MSIYAMSHVWKSAPVTGTELLMLLALADMANDDMECWPRIIHLASKTRLSERQATRVLTNLVKRGIIERLVKSGRGRRGEESNLYRITPEKWGKNDADVTTPGVADVTTGSDVDVTTPGVADVTTMNHHIEPSVEPAPSKTGKSKPPSSKGNELERQLILSWARAAGLAAIDLGAPLDTKTNLRTAKEMTAWPQPPTEDEIRAVVTAGQKHRPDYPFQFVPNDILQLRKRKALAKPSGVWASPVIDPLANIKPLPEDVRLKLVEEMRARRATQEAA